MVIKTTILSIILFLLLHAAIAAVEPVRAEHGMVVSACRFASETGVRVMKAGGNAVDAAVAVGFALAVTYPAAGNIGGGGFLVLRQADGTATTWDFREKAPAAAHRDMFLDAGGGVVPELSLIGPLASGVPGTVAGLYRAHQHYGRLPWKQLVEPAVQLARGGFPVGQAIARDLDGLIKYFDRFPSTRRKFERNGGTPGAGEIWKQPDLARTLERIRDKGADGFYRGETARLLIETMRQTGGIMTEEDLQTYVPVERTPVTGAYRGYRIITMTPPSSGGVLLCHMLGLLEAWDMGASGFQSAQTIHRMVEVMRRAYADRATHLGDPDFYTVPLQGLLSPEYIRRRRETINLHHATDSNEISAGVPGNDHESQQTTHYSIVDAGGNAVAVTYTLNGSFGSKLVVEGAGFLLNNEMDDFSAKPGSPNMFGAIGGEANAIQPGKRMLSSMTPVIVERDGKLSLVTGSPGGTRIITTVLQVIMNVVDHGMNIQQAVNAPRIHHQWRPDEIQYEPFGLSPDVIGNLVRMGHRLTEQPRYMGDANSIMIDEKAGERLGAPDPRTESAAMGY